MFLSKVEMEFRLSARIQMVQSTIVNDFFVVLNQVKLGDEHVNWKMTEGYVDVFKFEYENSKAHLIHLYKTDL